MSDVASPGLGARGMELKKVLWAHSGGHVHAHSVLGVQEKGHCHGSPWGQRRACQVCLKIVQGLQSSVTVELRFSLMDGRGGQERDFQLSKQSERVRQDSLSQRTDTQCHLLLFFFFFKKRKCNGCHFPIIVARYRHSNMSP